MRENTANQFEIEFREFLNSLNIYQEQKIDTILCLLFLKYLNDIENLDLFKIDSNYNLFYKEKVIDISLRIKKLDKIHELYNLNIFPEAEFSKIIDFLKKIDFKSIQNEKFKILNIFNVIFDKKYNSNYHFISSHYTPKNLSKLISLILSPKANDDILDPTCGFSTNLLELYEIANGCKLYGQDIDNRMVAYSQINLFINQIKEYEIVAGDVLTEDKFFKNDLNKKFDVIVSNPPFIFNIDKEEIIKLNNEKFMFGNPSSKGFLHALIQIIISKLKENGRAIIVVPNTILLSKNNDFNIIKNIIDSNLIESIISLPNKVFTNVAVKTSLILINKNLKNKDIFFVNLEKYLEINYKNNNLNLNDTDVNTISELINKKVEVNNISKKISLTEISENDYNLKTEKYTNDSLENLLPEGVETVELGEIAEIKSGTYISKERVGSEGDYFYITPKNVSNNRIELYDHKFNLKNEKEINSLILPLDIIVSYLGGNFKMLLVPDEFPAAIASPNIVIIRSKSLNPNILFRFFKSEIGKKLLLNNIETNLIGTTLGMINKTELLKIKIPQINLEGGNNMEFLQKTLKSFIRNVLLNLGWSDINIHENYEINGKNFDFALLDSGNIISIFEISTNNDFNENIVNYEKVKNSITSEIDYFLITQVGLLKLNKFKNIFEESRTLPAPIK